MAIRMSSIQFMYNYKKSLNKTYAAQQKLFEQADGSKIHRGSDDPIGYTHLMRYQFTDNENTQYTNNVNTAVSWMKNSDNIVSEMADHIKTFARKTNQAANSYLSQSDSKAIAQEMDALVDQIMSNCNYQLGDRFLFAGQKDLTQPFTKSSDKVDRGLAKNLDAKQAEFFRDTQGDINVSLYQMLTLESGDETYYLDTHTGYLYSQDFVDTDYKDLIANGYNSITEVDSSEYAEADLRISEEDALDTVESADSDTIVAIANGKISGSTDLKIALKRIGDSEDSDTNIAEVASATGLSESVIKTAISESENVAYFRVSDYFSNQRIINDTGREGLTVSIDGSDTTLDFVTIRQNVVTYSGDNQHISMVKLNGATDTASDIVNLTGQDMFGNDIFDDSYSGNEQSGSAMLNNLLAVYEKVDAVDAHWLTSDGVTLADVAHSTLIISETTMGARLQLYNSVHDMLDNQSVVITEDITNVSSTDIAELATKLMEMTTIYNLSLSLGGRVLPQSLADYL